jgi:hypothetical protein
MPKPYQPETCPEHRVKKSETPYNKGSQFIQILSFKQKERQHAEQRPIGH